MHGQFTSHIKFSDLHVYINVKIHGTYVIWDEARKTAKYYNWWIALKKSTSTGTLPNYQPMIIVTYKLWIII